MKYTIIKTRGSATPVTITKTRGSAAPVIIVLIFIFVLICGSGVVGLTYMSYSNNEIGLRNAIVAKQKDNESQLDNMQKKITQSGEITQEQAEAVAKLVRTPPQGTLLTAVQEAIPNLDQATFRQLMNVVTSSRDAFAQRQTEILDLKRAHDDARTKAPSSWICGGRPEIQVVIVTSDRAEESFRTGKDNDISIFKK